MNMKKNKIISAVAGRSGGHIIPCLTLAKKYTDDGYQLLFFTTQQELDSQILNNDTTVTWHIPLNMMNIPYKRVMLLPLWIGQCVYSFFMSLYQFIRHRPEKLISTGGYISIPVCLAAKMLLIEVDIYELNVVPGRATKFLAYFASNIFICFSKTADYFSKKTTVVPYPVRFALQDLIHKENHLLKKLDSSKKTILVLGGSQGSHFINQQVCQLVSLYGSSVQIIHQTGAEHITLLKDFYESIGMNAVVFSYQHNLADFYNKADIVICRSGAGTLFETLFFKKICLTIPLEAVAGNHQVVNAYALQKEYPNLFFVIHQIELQKDPILLFNKVSHFFDQPIQ